MWSALGPCDALHLRQWCHLQVAFTQHSFDEQYRSAWGTWKLMYFAVSRCAGFRGRPSPPKKTMSRTGTEPGIIVPSLQCRILFNLRRQAYDQNMFSLITIYNTAAASWHTQCPFWSNRHPSLRRMTFDPSWHFTTYNLEWRHHMFYRCSRFKSLCMLYRAIVRHMSGITHPPSLDCDSSSNCCWLKKLTNSRYARCDSLTNSSMIQWDVTGVGFLTVAGSSRISLEILDMRRPIWRDRTLAKQKQRFANTPWRLGVRMNHACPDHRLYPYTHPPPYQLIASAVCCMPHAVSGYFAQRYLKWAVMM
ncbi:hypothetical protein F5Y17DRAFT_305010 [Xylariaceae sp. FL0594]|nr:hypothetical protein F5Y17DRAFT_305010 [Xylariaceae sp. FL0594]